MRVSVVSPVYKAESIVEKLVSEITRSFDGLDVDFEIVLVEDRSPDESWAKIVKIAKENESVVGVRLSRNFGQHCAISAGLSESKGDVVVVMDCDLQDPPSMIPRFIEELNASPDLQMVIAARETREDSVFRKSASATFYGLLNLLSGLNFDSRVANYRAMRRPVVEAYLQLNESFRFFPIQMQLLGFTSKVIFVKHDPRFEGKSSYNLKRLIKLSIDIIIAFSERPLFAIVLLGFTVSFLSVVGSISLLVGALFDLFSVQGWVSLMLTICFFGGIILFSQGMLGLYILKNRADSRRRPIYFIESRIN